MIIAIIGSDGTGKSTLAKTLKEKLINKGKEVEIEYPFNYFILRKIIDLMRLFINFIKRKKSINLTRSNLSTGENKKNTARIFKIWPLFVLIDNWLYFLVKLNKKNRIIICDRYFYDLATSFDEFGYTTKYLYNLYLKYLPKPDYCFLLDCSEKISRDREEKCKHSIGFFIRQRERYLDIAKKENMIIFNTETESSDFISQAIIREIEYEKSI